MRVYPSKRRTGSRVNANTSYRGRRRIAASEEGGAEGGVSVEPGASELVFEAEDVAQLVAEVTGEPVDVTADEDTVTFDVGEESYTVEAEGNEEILEAARRPFRGKRTVAASTNRVGGRRTTRRVPSSRR